MIDCTSHTRIKYFLNIVSDREKASLLLFFLKFCHDLFPLEQLPLELLFVGVDLGFDGLELLFSLGLPLVPTFVVLLKLGKHFDVRLDFDDIRIAAIVTLGLGLPLGRLLLLLFLGTVLGLALLDAIVRPARQGAKQLAHGQLEKSLLVRVLHLIYVGLFAQQRTVEIMQEQ